MSSGSPEDDPGQMSLTRAVPAVVPSVFHNSVPVTPSLAPKYRLPPITSRYEANASCELMFVTRKVPTVVPSDFHTCFPVVLSLAAKYNAPLRIFISDGLESPDPDMMFLTMTVPAAVPSLSHSS